jgi:hypothetical protein
MQSISSSRSLAYGLRIGWLSLTLICLILHFTGLPYQYSILIQINATTAAELRAMNLPASTPAVWINVLDTVVVLGMYAMSALLIWRSDRTVIALITAIFIVAFAALVTGSVVRNPYQVNLVAFVLAVCMTISLLIGYAFPDGRFMPRWIIIFFPALVVWYWIAYWGVLPSYHASTPTAETFFIPYPYWLYFPNVTLVPIGIWLWSRRYRYHLTSEQRQQVKWVLLGITISVFIVAISIPDHIWQVFEALGISVTAKLLLIRSVRMLSLFLIPVTLLMSIRRYRLWQIDLALNRLLVSVSVIGTLLAMFVSIFVLVQVLLRWLAPTLDTNLSLVIPSLIAGALFNPIHQQARRFVDRRIYRLRFDLNELAHRQQSPIIKSPGRYTGQTIGGYTMRDVIGKGSRGEVYRAEMGQQVVAVKILEIFDEQNDARFEREAEVLTRLLHPDIVRLCEAGRTEGRAYLVFEYIEGRTLADVLRERRALSYSEINSILVDIADALDYAHANGVIHRDIKPSNIMLRAGMQPGKPRAMLMDFGVAKLAGSTTLTGTNAVGTIDYMSPEQIQRAGAVDPRTDVYALAAVAYEMVTGQQVYDGTPAQVMFAHVYQPSPDPRDLVPDLPETMGHAILRALSKNPAERYDSAGAFVGVMMAR